jgi:DeoR/GlpR family transcriptional regulator of sugar metabolism
VNDGSTCFHLATHLGSCGAVTVYTNSIAMIAEINRVPNVRLFVLGGECQRNPFSLNGGILERTLEWLEFDTVFLGADRIDADGRCLVRDEEVARTTQVMLRRGKRAILLADHTKVEGEGHVSYGRLEDFDLWITSQGLPAGLKRKLGRQTEIFEAESGNRKTKGR